MRTVAAAWLLQLAGTAASLPASSSSLLGWEQPQLETLRESSANLRSGFQVRAHSTYKPPTAAGVTYVMTKLASVNPNIIPPKNHSALALQRLYEYYTHDFRDFVTWQVLFRVSREHSLGCEPAGGGRC